ncbi:MAG: transcriptional repressor [Candidatus Vogelbacteria bacterium]|nr:transcriptional repressor [Candidatus Vogelbacteria bacterium]
MKESRNNAVSEILRLAGHKVTPGRVAMLEILQSALKPISILDIYRKLKNSVDQVTIYRALEALVESGLVRKVDFQHSHAHYEIVIKDDHHHHLICKVCGAVEDIENLDAVDFEKMALRKSKMFASIKSHSLEFFGLCKKCAKTSR